MELGLRLAQKQTLKLVMTPRLQQALKLLQMPSLDLSHPQEALMIDIGVCVLAFALAPGLIRQQCLVFRRDLDMRFIEVRCDIVRLQDIFFRVDPQPGVAANKIAYRHPEIEIDVLYRTLYSPSGIAGDVASDIGSG